MKRLLTLIALIIGAYVGYNQTSTSVDVSGSGGDSDSSIAQAFENRLSSVQVQGTGTVARILPDDNDGSRHQRFILSLNSGHSLLVAHNIDLAPRIDSISNGDSVTFFGEYEWNERGGVIHWTHHDPQRRHVGGWLEHNGQRYE